MPSLTLHVAAGPPLPPTPLEQGKTYSLGRASSQTIRLEDPAVSRRHAHIAFESSQWTISDLGSRHGTFLNGIQLAADQPTPLTDNDRLRIGPWTLVALSEDHRPSSLISLDDTRRRVEGVTSMGRDELGTLAERRLTLLMNSARAIHDASDEASVATNVVKALLEGTGFGRAAIIRPSRGFEELEVLSFTTATTTRLGQQGLSPSRTLLQEASKGRIVRMDETPNIQQAQSIIQMGVSQAICAPIFVGDTIDAYAYIDSIQSIARPEKDAMSFCAAIADLCGLAMSSLRRHELEIRQRQLLLDLQAAHDVQRRLMPADCGQIGVARYRMHLQSGRHIAGDLFGIVPLSETRAAVFLGDVSGKGLAAAILMATVQSHLAAALRHGNDPVACITTVNQFIAQHSADREFVTLFLAVIDISERTLTCIDAGHGYAAMILPDASVERLSVTGGLPIGIDATCAYQATTVPIERGARLVLFSDGIPEQQSIDGEEFGFARVLELLAKSGDMEADISCVTRGLREFAETDACADDVTLATIEPAL